ncbi:MAG: hypothetical protein H6573_32540 [Lewinellaceae bacterium]|nr:hypothetical protein [Lewinellaceae bacterium]
MQERSSSRLSEWLDNLARESWQLELVISGFAIFLLIGIYEPLWEWGESFQRAGLSPGMRNTLGVPFAILIAAWFILLGSLLYFIDFITLGYLKRIRWLAPVYYPIYRFFSLITFARLYRPLYYNLIDNRFGRGVGFLLAPYMILLIVGSSIKFISEAYFPVSTAQITTTHSRWHSSFIPK